MPKNAVLAKGYAHPVAAFRARAVSLPHRSVRATRGPCTRRRGDRNRARSRRCRGSCCHRARGEETSDLDRIRPARQLEIEVEVRRARRQSSALARRSAGRAAVGSMVRTSLPSSSRNAISDHVRDLRVSRSRVIATRSSRPSSGLRSARREHEPGNRGMARDRLFAVARDAATISSSLVREQLARGREARAEQVLRRDRRPAACRSARAPCLRAASDDRSSATTTIAAM